MLCFFFLTVPYLAEKKEQPAFFFLYMSWITLYKQLLTIIDGDKSVNLWWLGNKSKKAFLILMALSLKPEVWFFFSTSCNQYRCFCLKTEIQVPNCWTDFSFENATVTSKCHVYNAAVWLLRITKKQDHVKPINKLVTQCVKFQCLFRMFWDSPLL